MAKKKKVNKTQAIKQAIDSGADPSPKALSEYLAKQGIKVNAAYVSTIKSSLKARANRGKPGEVSVDDVFAMKQLVDEIGWDVARKAFDALAQLK